MNELPSDDALVRAHEVFGRDHERLRSELMAGLAKMECVRSERPRLRWGAPRWGPGRFVVAAAALIVLIATAWVLIPGGKPSEAFGIERIHQRMLEVGSLHLRGWLYRYVSEGSNERVERYPVEWYLNFRRF